MRRATSTERTTTGDASEVLRVDGVSHAFGGVAALSDVSFLLERGEKVGLIGPNGAGKTTLLNCLTGLQRPMRGEISVLGRSPAKVGPHGLARLGVSRSFQSVSLFPTLTPRQNAALAVGARSPWFPYRVTRSLLGDRSIKAQADAVLDEAGLRDIADISAGDLPYGTKRRLDLAMALAGEPSLLLLDEPSAGLSREEGLAVVSRIEGLADTAVLLIDHDVDIVFAACDRIIVLHEGMVLADGTVDDIRASDVVQAAYFGRSHDAP